MVVTGLVMMDIQAYKKIVDDTDLREYPDYNTGTELLSDFIPYEEITPELKLYLCKLILCRSFYGTYTAWYDDVTWYIRGFFSAYQQDYVKPWLSETIKEVAMMIISEQTFTKGVIGTTFMFGVLEFYAKYKLGFRPLEFDFFDKRKKEYVRQLDPKLKNDLSIKPAFVYLQKTNQAIAGDLNDIDRFTIQRLTGKGIPADRWTPHAIADRINLARNPMLHGETHTFYQTGAYLVMLYILFHLNDERQAK
jgi:hypothetical protein